MGRTLIAGLTVLAALGLSAAPAMADNSFAGTCDPIQGTATFDTPLSNTEADNGYHFTGTGTCDGTLNGASVTDAPIDAQVDGKFHGSCQGSESTAPGPGKLVFTKGTPDKADDVTITFTMDFTGVASEVDFTLTGTKSGSSTGHASFVTTRTPLDIAAKCAQDGNSQLPFDAKAKTDSALTSETAPTPTNHDPGQTPVAGGGGTTTQSGAAPQGSRAGTAANIDVPRQSLKRALTSGLQVSCTAACTVKVTLAKKLARRFKVPASIAAGRGSGTVVAKFTATARKRLRKARSLTVTVTALVGGATVTRTVTLKR